MAELEYKLTNDTLFKMLFVKYPDLLKRLVSKILGLATDSITEFTITNPEMPPQNVGEKFCRLDINMTVNAQQVNIEVQVKDEGDYPMRSLYYWARNYSSALKEGGKYYSLPRTIVINIVDFELFADTADFHSEFRALEITRHTELTDRMSLHYFELPKLPEIAEADDELKLWLALFNAKTEEDLSKLKNKGGIMEQAVMAYKSVAESNELRESLRLSELARYNEASALHKKALDIAAKMKAEGVSIDVIIKCTGLTGDDIVPL
jgi:predicted transposase/invertase (TIGR01784 family)